MRILIVYNRYITSGGEDTYFYGLVRTLRSHGHTVKTYIKESNTLANNPLKQLITASSLLFNPFVYHELTNLIKKFRPDVVQCMNLFPLIGYTTYYACKSMSVPVVQRINNYRLLCMMGENNKGFACDSFSQTALLASKISYGLQKFMNPLSIPSLYIFPSDFIKNKYLNTVEHDKSVVIPAFFISNTCFKSRIRSNYFLYFGRLSKEKGVFNLLKAFSTIPEAQLILIGSGPLKSKITQYNKNKNIKIYERMSYEKLKPFIRNARYTILPSQWYDVLPNVLVESFSQGTPVIAPRYGVFPELIQNKKTGFLYRYNSENDFQNCIRMAIQSDPNKMLAHIRDLYNEKYNHKQSYKNSLLAYQTAIANSIKNTI